MEVPVCVCDVDGIESVTKNIATEQLLSTNLIGGIIMTRQNMHVQHL